jgi:hypothetical protein
MGDVVGVHLSKAQLVELVEPRGPGKHELRGDSVLVAHGLERVGGHGAHLLGPGGRDERFLKGDLWQSHDTPP